MATNVCRAEALPGLLPWIPMIAVILEFVSQLEASLHHIINHCLENCCKALSFYASGDVCVLV